MSLLVIKISHVTSVLKEEAYANLNARKEKEKTMNKTNFANGLNHFCSACGIFFDVKLESAVEEDIRPLIAVCPICGNDELISSIDEFLEYLEDSETDPVGFYKAFPPDEPIPNSCTGATPR